MATDGDRLLDEGSYDRLRARQWLAGAARGDGLSRRTLLQVSAGAGLAALAGLGRPGRAAADPVPASADPAAPADSPIVKPLPPDLFYVYGTNAEMRWEAMRGRGELVPIDRFFVRDHTRTPLIDADTWRLRVFGAGLRGAPTVEQAVEFSYRDLRRMPDETITASVECAGNGRSFFTTQ